MEQHIAMLLDNYSSLRTPDSTTLSSSSDTGVPKSAPVPSRKLVLQKEKQNGLPPCKGASCGSSDVIEDVNAGSVVCIQCGLIQSMSVFESARTGAIFHEGVGRTVGHRYSRIAYLRGVLKSLCGETRLELSPEESTTLRSYFPSDAKQPTGLQMRRAIKKLKLPPKYLYHAHTIAFQLYRTVTPNPSEQEIRDVLRLFRVLESAWDRLPLAGSVRKGRKKFLSYPVVWNQLCLQLGFVTLSTLLPPLRNEKVRDKQLLIFNQLVDYINQ